MSLWRTNPRACVYATELRNCCPTWKLSAKVVGSFLCNGICPQLQTQPGILYFRIFQIFLGSFSRRPMVTVSSSSQVMFRSRGAGLVAPVLTKMFPCLGMCPRHLRLIELKDWQQLHTLDNQIWQKPVDVHLDTVQIRRFHLLGFKLLKIQKER